MSETYSPYLDRVIKEVKQIAKFDADFDLYKENIKVFLKYNGILGENITALANLLTDSSDTYKCYEIKNGEITFHKEQTTNGKEITLSSKYSLKDAGNEIAKILKKENIQVSEPNFDSSLSVFNEKFALGGFYTNSKVIEFLSLNPIRESAESKFWQEYILSIVEAEYLSDDRYSQKLKDVIDDLIVTISSNDNRIELTSFYLIKSFVRVSWLVIEFCNRTANILEETKPQNQIVVNTDRRLRFYSSSSFSNISFEIGEENTRPWERLLESVVEMTNIDHRYIDTDKNIDKLLLLWGRLNFFPDENHPKPIKFMIDENLRKAIKIKTAGLLNGIMKTRKEGSALILNGDVDIEKEIEKEAEKLTACYFTKGREQFKYENTEYAKLEVVQNDVEYYDNYAKKGVMQYCDNRDARLQLATSDIKKINEIVSKPIIYQKLIVDLFKNVSDETKGLIREKSDKVEIQERLDVLCEIEKRLQEFIDIHKTSKTFSFRPLFKNSFYKIENDKLIPATIDNKTIFFASAELPPIKINSLEKNKQEFAATIRELHHKYNQLSITTSIEKTVESSQDDFKKQIKDVQTSQITILGVFAGLITFVTSSVGFFKVTKDAEVLLQDSIRYYAIFAFILILGLGLFALFLKLLFNSNKSDTNLKNWLFALILVSVAILFSIIFLL